MLLLLLLRSRFLRTRALGGANSGKGSAAAPSTLQLPPFVGARLRRRQLWLRHLLLLLLLLQLRGGIRVGVKGLCVRLSLLIVELVRGKLLALLRVRVQLHLLLLLLLLLHHLLML